MFKINRDSLRFDRFPGLHDTTDLGAFHVGGQLGVAGTEQQIPYGHVFIVTKFSRFLDLSVDPHLGHLFHFPPGKKTDRVEFLKFQIVGLITG